jgi:hypothetical protein
VSTRCPTCGYGYSQRGLGEVCGNRTALVQQEIQAPVCLGRLVTVREFKKYAERVDAQRRRRRADRAKH